ncbi:MAG: MATE family efflux transporter [Eubacteriales bacterium]
MFTSSARKKDLTEGPLFGKILLFTIPLILTGMLQLLYNATDTIVAGRFSEDGETALAAVGSCGSLISLLVNAFLGLSVGAGVLVAQHIGAREEDDVRRTVHTAVPAAALLGIFVSVVGFFLTETLLRWTGVEESVLAQAVPYMKAYMLGVPASMVYNYCAIMLRSSGDTTHPLLFLSIAGMVNIVLNLITVIYFHLGALGVGIATAISTWLSAFLIIRFMMREQGLIHFDPKEMRLHRDKLRKMTKIGIPAGLQSCVFSISNVFVQSGVNSFGKTIVAGNAAAANIDGFIYTAMNSFYHSTLTFVGQHVGAKKHHRIRKIIWLNAGMVAVCGAAIGLLAFTFGRQLLSLYAPGNSGAIEAGLVRMSIVTVTYFFCGLMEVGCGAMRGMGSPFIPMVVSIAGTCALRIGWIYTVFAAYPTTKVLYCAYPVSWILTAAIHYICCEILFRYISKKEARRPVLAPCALA